MHEAIKKIIHETDTVLKAPPGYVFRKPSQNANTVFIRTGNALKDPSASAVLFHALIRVLPLGATVIHVDSFTILSIALKLQTEWPPLAQRCGVSIPVPSIRNFHSYAIDEELRFNGDPNAVVLISATTSGGLAKKLVEKHGANRSRIFHLLVFSHIKSLSQTAAYFETSHATDRLRSPRHLKEINIPSEEFMASHSDAREIRFTTKLVSLDHGGVLMEKFYSENIGIRLAADFDRSYCPIGIDLHGGIGTSEFQNWLEKEVRIKLPVSVRLIVATDTGRSLGLANRIRELMSTHLGIAPDVKTVSQVAAGEIPNGMGEDVSVVVVSAEEMNGDSLLKASLALRDVPHLHRHYLCGHFFGESAPQHNRLKSNLTLAGGGARYGWSEYCSTFIGDVRLNLSWKREQGQLDLLRDEPNYTALGPQLSDALKTRYEAFSEPVLKGAKLFFPRMNGQPLELRPGSVLFPKGYGQISQAVVYVQVASALQRARDGVDYRSEALPDKQCFVSSPFVDSLLSPNTFEQFNDGVIGASILRACCPSELNYARSRTMSAQMRRVLEAVIERRDEKFGEAVLEFLFAFHNQTIRLLEEDESAIRLKLRSVPELSAFMDAISREPII
jgi:hypothetical protein